MEEKKTMLKENDPSMQPLSWFTRIAYGLGDTAQNVVYGAMTILTFFYTDYVGISAATVGLVMLISRCFDGFSDIVMGFIVERTSSKWGKARPWILWMAVPFCISIVLIYTVPAGTEFVKSLYILVTYNLCTTVCFTAMNLPYGSLSTMMTRLSRERDMLSIVRMTLSPLGKILAISATLPLVTMLGDDQAAWIKVMTIWAVVALVLLLICFFKCEETVVFQAREVMKEKIPAGKQIKCLVTNQYFWFAMLIWTMQCVIQNATSTILPYYCRYIFNNSDLYSVIFLLETLVMVGVSITLGPTMLKKFGKRNMALIGIVIALASHLVYMMNPYNFGFVIMSCIMRGVGFAPMNSVVFGFLGDVVDFGQWKYHIRQEGLIFSGSSVGTKLGQGLTAAGITKCLDIAGYISSTGSVEQPESALNMIVDLYRVVPLIIWVFLIILLLCYRLDKKYDSIVAELNEREARGEM